MDLNIIREKVHRARIRLAALDLLCRVAEQVPSSAIHPDTEKKILMLSHKLLNNDEE